MKENKSDILSRYERARIFEQEALTKTMALNATIFPKWIDGYDCFIYARETKTGKEYRLVDADERTEIEAFDHMAFSRALSKASGKKVDVSFLSVNNLRLSFKKNLIKFEAYGMSWCFCLISQRCKKISKNPPHWLLSPDGKKAVYTRDYNLWLKDLDSGEEYALTKDGERHNAYASLPEKVDLVSEFSPPVAYFQSPQMLWSPDSKQLFTMQTDERQVLSLPVTEYVTQGQDIRPRSWQPHYALPGDESIVGFRMIVIDVEAKLVVDTKYPMVLDTGVMPGLFMRKRSWWSKDCKTVYFVDMSRYEKEARIVACDAKTGDTKIIFKESSNTYIDLNLSNEEICTFLPLPDTSEILWFSERSSWAHIYLYDLVTGQLLRQVTQGEWLVREILGFDAIRRELYFQAAGRADSRDPYYREICRVNVDSGVICSVASSDHDYIVHKLDSSTLYFCGSYGRDVVGVSGLAPSCNYFVTTRSRIDENSISELRDRDGNIVMELTISDTTNLPSGWQWPEPVKLLAADGETHVYGAIFRPTDFNPDKLYPVIDYTIGLPFVSFVPKNAFFTSVINAAAYLSAAAWAELGFIVVIIDGRGTTFRDKKFHDSSYGQVHTASNLEDHVCGIKQLAARYSYMDINRVGISGPGGCISPVYGLAAFPEFYKVGVACSIYDIRLAAGFESYCGPQMVGHQKQVLPEHLAHNLQGHLLLIHGALDNFFQLAGMFGLVESLIQANKCFDMLVLPRGGHMLCDGYSLCRAWDYMVEHLQGNQPPVGFRLKTASQYASEQN